MAAYRFLDGGTFGRVVTLERGKAHTRVHLTRRRPCEDRDGFALSQESVNWPAPPALWRRVDACMERGFWNAPILDDLVGDVHHYVRVCGPGAHEASCVVGQGYGGMVEGLRDGSRHLVVRPTLGFPPSSSHHDALDECWSLIEQALVRRLGAT